MPRWYYCNILQVEQQRRHLWHFGTEGQVRLLKEKATTPEEGLPENLVARDWKSLVRPQLNIAWLPPDEIFLRVVQFPLGTPEETAAMVELQLEKISPVPVAQAFWAFQVVPAKKERADGQQTVAVVVVPKPPVEQFLKNLEQQGYLADRLDLKFFDQILAAEVEGDGVWIYPGLGADQFTFVLAWWYGGVLRHIGLANVPMGENSGEILREQIDHMTWAGEMEGWLTGPPKLQLVVNSDTASVWEPLLNRPGEDSVSVVRPLADGNLANRTAERAVQDEAAASNLLPPEYASRYHQRFIDRLWMRGLAAVLSVYAIFVLIYFGWLQFYKFQNGRVENQLAGMDRTFKQAQEMKERIRLAETQLSLKSAAIDCLKAVSEILPAEFVLTDFNYSESRELRISGTAPKDFMEKPGEFFLTLREATNNAGMNLFSPTGGTEPSPRLLPGNQEIQWSFALDLPGKPSR